MEKKHKAYLKMNIMSLFFIFISFTSVTLAWFAYSGISSVSTEVNVKAWYIELENNGETVSKDITISLSDIYPGMETVTETIDVKNQGDSDAQVKYSIVSARILGDAEDNYIVDETLIQSEYVEDILSHEYPFHINMNLSRNYVLPKGEESSFQVAISWPLDSDSDSLDSLWGTKAYTFQSDEETKKLADENYQIMPSIQVVLTVTAEQYIEEDSSSDPLYDLGDVILFDVINNQRCTEISSTCLNTYVIDTNNTLGDETVTLLPDPKTTYLNSNYGSYATSLATITTNWTVNTRPLLIEDLLKIVSRDVTSSFLVGDDISDLIIGNLNYGTRMSTELARALSYNGYYTFANEKFGYMTAGSCFWTNTEYDTNNGYAVIAIDETISKIYGLAKSTSCNVVPVILASKANLLVQ